MRGMEGGRRLQSRTTNTKMDEKEGNCEEGQSIPVLVQHTDVVSINRE